jgi:hypothetical protein
MAGRFFVSLVITVGRAGAWCVARIGAIMQISCLGELLIMTNTFCKKWFGWMLTGYRPRCQTCGELMEVGELFDSRGTQYFCADRDNDAHAKEREMYGRWIDKIKVLQAELEAEDSVVRDNFARQVYGAPLLELKRKFK